MKKLIKGYENYSISDTGIVTNEKTGRILKPNNNGKGYLYIRLGYKSPNLYIHKLVAEAFISNPENLPEIDHINTVKSDNSVSNLRWCSHKENMNNSLTLKKTTATPSKGQSKLAKKVQGISLMDGSKVIFNSLIEAAEFVGCKSSSNISNNIAGRIKQVKGYVWSFI